jgi:hypothetical protein
MPRQRRPPPPPLLIPSATAEFYARPGDLNRSKVASRIIKPSVASRHIFGGGGEEGGDGGKQQRGRRPSQRPSQQ